MHDLDFEIAHLFLEEEHSATQIAELLPGVTREGVYPAIRRCVAAGYITLHPPVDKQLTRQVAETFNIHPDFIRVVDVPSLSWLAPARDGRHPREDEHQLARDLQHDRPERFVSAVAADLVLDLILTLGRQRWWGQRKSPVILGLGPGRATLDFSLFLSRQIRNSTDGILLRLVATSAGGPAEFPQFASSSFFNLFPKENVESAFGMFASPLVTQAEFVKPSFQKQPGFQEAFSQKELIDILVTSMGDISDPHDLLRLFLHKAGRNIDDLIKRGWLGSVQYLPYSKTAPIRCDPNEPRCPTLFEIDELRARLGQANKFNILIARKCTHCPRDRSEVLYPLLRVPELRVWSHVVMDTLTARGLLAIAEREGLIAAARPKGSTKSSRKRKP